MFNRVWIYIPQTGIAKEEFVKQQIWSRAHPCFGAKLVGSLAERGGD